MKTLLIYPTLSKGQVHPNLPLGLLYIASVLRENDYDVSIYDTSWDHGLKNLEQHIIKNNPNLVGISSSTINFENSLVITSLCKSINPDIKTCLGGPHPTAFPVEHPDVDYVIRGEGEFRFLRLVQYLSGETDLCDKQIMENLDDLPLPAWDLLLMEKYLRQPPPMPLSKMSFASVMTSRGCPFNCSFCQPMLRRLFGKKVRRRTPQNVVNEIKILNERYNVNSLSFHDDTMGMSLHWVQKFAELMDGMDVEWLCQNRVDKSSYETLKAMSKAGCKAIFYGVESGSDDIRNGVLRKGVTVQQIKKAFSNCADLGIITRANFMIGSPSETPEQIWKSVKLMKEIDPDTVMVHITTPMPGTDLYDIAAEQGMIKKVSGSRHDPDVMKLEISPQELEEFVKKFQRVFFRNNLLLLKRKRLVSSATKRWWNVYRSGMPFIQCLKWGVSDALKISRGYWN